jgi:hypothetical protein
MFSSSRLSIKSIFENFCITKSQGYCALQDVIIAAAEISVAKIYACPSWASLWMIGSLMSFSSGTVPLYFGSFFAALPVLALSQVLSKA